MIMFQFHEYRSQEDVNVGCCVLSKISMRQRKELTFSELYTQNTNRNFVFLVKFVGEEEDPTAESGLN